MGFADYKDAEQIQDFQRRILSRPGRGGKKSAYLLHYTDIYNIVNILSSGKIYLSSCEGMNDGFEKRLFERHGMQNSLFYLCLSKAEESLAMYKMYQRGAGRTAILMLSYYDLDRIITQSPRGKFPGGIDDDGRYVQSHRYVDLIRDDREVKETIGASLYCVEVLYVNPSNNAINSRTSVNRHIQFPFREQELIGSIKHQCWSYEQEVRLCGYTDRPLAINEKVALNLPKETYASLKVLLGPDFDNDANRDALHSLSEYGIDYTRSLYSDFYAGVL